MRLLAPAKINLHLRVGPRRADGFHPLLSWMTTVGLFDTLILETEAPAQGTPLDPARTGSGPVAPVTLVCDMPGLPCDERNLVVKIALAWREAVRSDGGERIHGVPCARPEPVRQVRATLHKRIPVGAGLGGGSSDAARALLGLNQLWGSGRAADDLSAFAARFGSDLPFFFHGPSSACQGRGEIVTPLPKPTPRWAVLVLPRLSMPTADVYRRFDQMGLGGEQDVSDVPDWSAWAKLASEQLLPRLVNDLEPPAFEIAPQLGELRDRIERLLGRPVRMSGSGSSLFTLFDTEPQAKEAATRIERETNERAPAIELSPILNDDLNEEFINR